MTVDTLAGSCVWFHMDCLSALSGLIHMCMSCISQIYQPASCGLSVCPKSSKMINLIASAVSYAVIAFCGPFRGNEVFLTDLYGLKKYLDDLARKDYIIMHFPGKYKRE